MTLGKFDHKITEARAAIRDPEGFWTFGPWVDQQAVFAVNDDIGAGKAKLIPSLHASPIITFGRGFHYQVEAITRCAICGQHISFEETGELSACHADQHEAGLDSDASFFA